MADTDEHVEDVEAFRLRARAWLSANLPTLDGADPWKGHAQSEAEEAERAKLYAQAQVIFKEQAPWFTIAHAVQLKPINKRVVDFKLSPFGRHNFYGVDVRE